MRISIKKLFWFCALFVCVSCHSWYRTYETLREAEDLVTSKPDSVIILLDRIPRYSLHIPSVRAPYALLYTQAQLASNIAVDKDTLISDAVAYYRLVGSRNHRFRSWLYLGWVLQNADNREGAMEAYAKAGAVLKRGKHLSEHRYCYYLHLNKSMIYTESFDYEKAINETELAIKDAINGGYGHLEFRARLNLAVLYGNSGDRLMSRRYLDSCRIHLSKASESGRLDYYTEEAESMQKNGCPPDRVASLLDSLQQEFANVVDTSYTWNLWARLYTRTGDAERSLELLERMPLNYYTATTYSVLSQTLDSLHRPQESLEAYRKYVALSDSLDLVLFRQDSRFIEERHNHELRKRRISEILFAVIAALSVLAAVLFVRLRKRQAERARLDALYQELRDEYENLKKVSENKAVSDTRARELLGERFLALRAFFSENKTDSQERVYSRIESLAEDRKELVETIGLLFGVYHPRFVSMLLDARLTTSEIGFCCMHVLGFRTSEIGDVVNRSGYYNMSGEIRKKLPIGSQKLATWLNARFGELA